MAFSTKSRLEELEVREGENRVLQRFAAENAAKHPDDSLADALDLVINREPSQLRPQAVVEKPFRARWRSHYEEIPVYAWLLQFAPLGGAKAAADMIGPFRNPADPDIRSVNETLNREWQLFKQTLDKDRQVRDAKERRSWRRQLFNKKTAQASPRWRVDTKAGQPLGIEDIITSVDDAKAYWESKPRIVHGKVQEGFHAFCKSLHTHSNLMKCLPDQNQYLSIFCGVTTTLIMASVNHQNMAEVLSTSLGEISEPIEDCEKVVSLMNTNDMHEAISSLYSHVFHFLYSAMKWYQACSSRRILNSLIENSSDSFKDQVSKIKEICNLIYRKGNIKSQAELRDTRLRFEDEAAKAAIAREEDAIAREEAREEARKQRISVAKMTAFGQQMEGILRENTLALYHKDEDNAVKHRSSGFSTRRLTDRGDDALTNRSAPGRGAVATTTTRTELQQWSAELEDFTSNISEFLNLVEFSTTFAELEIIEAIRDWSQSSGSRSLWVRGRFQEIYPSDGTAIAAKVITTARMMGIPFLCFFFGIDDVEDEGSQRMSISPCASQEEALAVDFVYILIRQLIDQLPAKVELARKRLKTLFDKLDGSLHTINTALRILEELLEQAPATLLVIVDGLELVGESDAGLIVTEVVLLLQRMTTETRREKVIKVLYTIAGTSDILESLDEDHLENVEVEEGRPKHMKDRLRSLEDVDLTSDASTTGTASTVTDDDQSD